VRAWREPGARARGSAGASYRPELKKAIHEALNKPGRTEGVRRIAERFGVNAGTVFSGSAALSPTQAAPPHN
jgi:transposase-like protein